jgi:predicted Holliday junction resolvase-like endonuclease
MEDSQTKKIIISLILIFVLIFGTTMCQRSDIKKLNSTVELNNRLIETSHKKIDLLEDEIMLQRIMISDKNNKQRIDSLMIINDQQRKHLQDYKQTIKNINK